VTGSMFHRWLARGGAMALVVSLMLGGCQAPHGAPPTATNEPTATVAPSGSAEPTATPTMPPSVATYMFTDLGVLGGLDSAARAVSESGVVVGHADTEPNSRWNGYHAFWWPPMAGAMFDLGTIPGDRNSSAEGINGINQIAGVSLAADGRTHAFVWDGQLHDLGNLGDERAEANDINESGQVTGASAAGSEGQHAFLWTPSTPNGVVGAMVDLGVLPDGVGSYGMDINDVGQVVGYANDQEYMSQPFLWTPDAANGGTGTMIELPHLPRAEHGVAEAINASGSVVGTQEVGSPYPSDRAFLWTPTVPNGESGTLTDLGTLGGDHSYAFGINAAGDVVGYAQLPGSAGVDHAYLFRDGVMVDLNSVLPADVEGVELMMAEAISDNGQIVGSAMIDGHVHAFLLTPSDGGMR
jgi:probable HAF family extracellular repeat protein